MASRELGDYEEIKNTKFGSNPTNKPNTIIPDPEGKSIDTTTIDSQKSYNENKTSLFLKQNETTIEKFVEDATKQLFRATGNAANQGGIGLVANRDNNTASSVAQEKLYKLFELVARLNGIPVEQKNDDTQNFTLYRDGNKIIGARYLDADIGDDINDTKRFTQVQNINSKTFTIDLDNLGFGMNQELQSLISKTNLDVGNDAIYPLKFSKNLNDEIVKNLITKSCQESLIGKDNKGIKPYVELAKTCGIEEGTIAAKEFPNFKQRESTTFSRINKGYKYDDLSHKKYSDEVESIIKDIKSSQDEIFKILKKDAPKVMGDDLDWKIFENYYNNKEKIDELMLQYNNAIKRRDAITDSNYKNDDGIKYHIDNFKALTNTINRPISGNKYKIFLNNEGDTINYNPEFLNISNQHGVEKGAKIANLYHNHNDEKVANGIHEMEKSLVGGDGLFTIWSLDTSLGLKEVRERIVNGIKTNGWLNIIMLPVAVVVSIIEGALSVVLLPFKILALAFSDNKVSSRYLQGSIMDSIRNGFGLVAIYFSVANLFKSPDQVLNNNDSQTPGMLSKTLSASLSLPGFAADQFLYSKNALSGVSMVGYGLAQLNPMGFNVDIDGKKKHISAKDLFSRWKDIKGTDKRITELQKKIEKKEKFNEKDILDFLHIYAVMELQAGRAVDMDNFQNLLNGTLQNQNLNHTVLQYANLDVHNHEIKKKLLGTVIAAARAGLAIGAYYSYGTTESTTEQRDKKNDLETWFSSATSDGKISDAEKYQLEILKNNGLISTDTYNAGLNGNIDSLKTLFANDYKLMDTNIGTLNNLINQAASNVKNGSISQQDLAALSFMEKGNDTSMNSVLSNMITNGTSSITTSDFVDRTLQAGGTLSTFEQSILKNQILSNPSGSNEVLKYISGDTSLSADSKTAIQNAIGSDKLSVIMLNTTNSNSIFYNDPSKSNDTYDTLLSNGIINKDGVVLDVTKFNQQLPSLKIGEGHYASSFLTTSPSGNSLNVNTAFEWSNNISNTQYANGSSLSGKIAPGSGGNGNIIFNNNSGGNGNIIKQMTEISAPTSTANISPVPLNTGSHLSNTYQNPYYYGPPCDYTKTAIEVVGVAGAVGKIAHDASQNPNTNKDSVKESTEDHTGKFRKNAEEAMSRKNKEEIPSDRSV
jgi:hypothetical protein